MWWWFWVIIPLLFLAWAAWKYRGREGDGKDHTPRDYGNFGGGM